MSLRKFRENPGIQTYPENKQQWTHWVNEVAKWITDTVEFATAQTDIITSQTTADTGVTNAATAQTALELNNVTVESLSQSVVSDTSGNWPADFTTDHVLSFKRQGVEIATHTIRAVWDQGDVDFTLTSQAESGEATVETFTGSGGADAKAVVSHTGSGIIGKVTANSTNTSGTSTSPSK